MKRLDGVFRTLYPSNWYTLEFKHVPLRRHVYAKMRALNLMPQHNFEAFGDFGDYREQETERTT